MSRRQPGLALTVLTTLTASLAACASGGSLSPTPTVEPEAEVEVIEQDVSIDQDEEVPAAVTPTVATATPEVQAQELLPEPPGVRVEVVAQDLEIPWALAFAPDGRLFFTERIGRLRVIENGVLRPEPVAEFPTSSWFESGLLGLALDPHFAENHLIYVCYTYKVGEEFFNRVVRFAEGSDPAQAEVVIDGIPGGFAFHIGGRLRFGPDGKLYIGTGDAAYPPNSQDLESLGGKILRLNPDGSVPNDNPFPNSPVFSWGNRNVQGFDWHPVTGTMFATEHGPSGEFELTDNDELNVIQAGENYGWPLVVGAAAIAGYVDPVLVYIPAVAPSGLSFYTGTLIPGWTNSLFFTALRGQHLQRVVLGEDNLTPVRLERLFATGEGQGVHGRIRDVITGPDGALYFATSNRDGRNEPKAGDDFILRIVPE